MQQSQSGSEFVSMLAKVIEICYINDIDYIYS